MYPQPQTGDVLLYSTPDDLVDWIIERTGPAAHVEIYEGEGKSLASRNGLGVARYDLRTNGIIAVLRPLDFDMAKFSAWFEKVNGEGYDWVGLEGFVEAKVTQEPNHLFCSAFVATGAKCIGKPFFNKMWAGALITPSDMFKSVMLHWQWVDNEKVYMVTV